MKEKVTKECMLLQLFKVKIIEDARVSYHKNINREL